MTLNLTENYTKLMEVVYQYEFYQSTNFIDYQTLEEETKNKLDDLIERLNEVDTVIKANLFNYTIDRLNKVDLSIIRIAVYEFIKEEIPFELVFNTAIDLSKEYSDLDDEKQHKFTNKLLDNIYKSLKE